MHDTGCTRTGSLRTCSLRPAVQAHSPCGCDRLKVAGRPPSFLLVENLGAVPTYAGPFLISPLKPWVPFSDTRLNDGLRGAATPACYRIDRSYGRISKVFCKVSAPGVLTSTPPDAALTGSGRILLSRNAGQCAMLTVNHCLEALGRGLDARTPQLWTACGRPQFRRRRAPPASFDILFAGRRSHVRVRRSCHVLRRFMGAASPSVLELSFLTLVARAATGENAVLFQL